MRLLFAILRIVVALAIASAFIAQLMHSIALLQGTTGFDPAFFVTNFFSFFTIDSNVASVVVLLVGAGLAIRRTGSDPMLFTTVRACVVTYMVTTGIVYNLLLRGIALPQGQTLEWSNEILHVVGPIYLLLDWLFAPGRIALSYRRLWAIVAFPVVWVSYTLIRGPRAIDAATGKPWYPYPFLNPASSANGYLSVALYVLLIAVIICAIGVGVIWVSRRGGGRPLARGTAENAGGRTISTHA